MTRDDVLAAVRQRPGSARDVATTLGFGTSPAVVTEVRSWLRILEIEGLAQRHKVAGKPWIWEPVITGSDNAARQGT